MATRGVTFERVREMMLALPGVEEGSSYGTPGFRVAKKFMSRLREDDVLVLKPVDDMERQFLMETQAKTFFVTDHYRGSDAMLVRLSKVSAGELRGLIERCWRSLASKKMIAAHEGEDVGVGGGAARTAAARTRAR